MKNQLRELPKFDNIKEIIYNSVKLYAENIAFTIKKKVENKTEYINITYEKLLQDINSLGTMLHKKELKRKRVAIIGKNRYEWSISHLACLMGGIVSVPLDKDLQYDELENSLIRSKADMIFFDKKYVFASKEALHVATMQRFFVSEFTRYSVFSISSTKSTMFSASSRWTSRPISPFTSARTLSVSNA